MHQARPTEKRRDVNSARQTPLLSSRRLVFLCILLSLPRLPPTEIPLHDVKAFPSRSKRRSVSLISSSREACPTNHDANVHRLNIHMFAETRTQPDFAWPRATASRPTTTTRSTAKCGIAGLKSCATYEVLRHVRSPAPRTTCCATYDVLRHVRSPAPRPAAATPEP